MVTGSYLRAPAAPWVRQHLALTWTLGTAAAILAGPFVSWVLVVTRILEGDLGIIAAIFLITGLVSAGCLAGFQAWILTVVLDPSDQQAAGPGAWAGAVLGGVFVGVLAATLPIFNFPILMEPAAKGLVLMGALGAAQVLVAMHWRAGSLSAKRHWLWAWAITNAAGGAAAGMILRTNIYFAVPTVLVLVSSALLFGAITGDLLAARITETAPAPDLLRYYRGVGIALALAVALLLVSMAQGTLPLS